MEDITSEEVEVIETEEADTAEPGLLDDGAEQKAQETKQKASAMGWVPEDQFRGDKSKWVSAEEFVRRGENEMPILRERLDFALKKQADQDRVIQDLVNLNSTTEKRAYERALKNLKKEQLEAVQLGDVDKFSEINEEIEELQSAQIKAPEQKAPANPIYDDWLSNNAWFKPESGDRVSRYANSIYEDIARENPLASYRQVLDAVAKETKERFPEKFTNQRRTEAASVQRVAGNGGKPKSRFGSLSQEARDAFDRFTKQGVKMDKEEYARQVLED